MPVRESAESVIDALRNRVVRSATSPFGHAPYPLSRTLEFRGDPGLLGPDSISWTVIGDVAAFIGGIRALLVQTALPEVAAGVGQHSRYREDPLGRLSRTSSYVTATTYGSMPEVERAVSQVRRAHGFVSGISSRGIRYAADDPSFSAWVHNVLTDSFLTAHLTYGGIDISYDEADQFVLEQTRIGALLGSDPMPTTRQHLADWVAGHPDIGQSPEMKDTIAFLTDPPLDPAIRIGYRVLLEAAVATIPEGLRELLGLSAKFGAGRIGKSAVAGLRWALGYSPTWRLALDRAGAPIPEGLFTQEPRVA